MDNQPNSEENNCDNDSNLNSILDDALGDFNQPIPPKRNQATSSSSSNAHDAANVWPDDFIAAATKNFEETMKTIMNQQNETSEGETETEPNGSLDLGAMSVEFAKFAETAAKAATESSTNKDFAKCLSDTMQQMTKNKEEAQSVPSSEELEKMFESFGLGGGGNGNVDGNELGSLFPIMQTMLENILSKDILYPPLKEIVMKYPDWLADNRTKLSEEDYTRYNKQYDLMKQVVEKFESEADEDSEEMKAKNSEGILMLMQKLQELGQPPMDLMGDYEPLMNLDEKGNVAMPDLYSLLGGAGFPSLGADTAAGPLAAAFDPQAGEGDKEACALM